MESGLFGPNVLSVGRSAYNVLGVRNEWLPVSSASLVIGAAGLFFVAHTLPRPDGAGQVLEYVATMNDGLLSPAVMLMVAGSALIFGLPTIATLFDGRARIGVFGLVCMVMGAVSLLGFAHQLMLVRSVVDRHAQDDARFAELMAGSANGWLLVVGFLAFYVGELCVAWALSRVCDVPSWVPASFLVHVALGAVSLPYEVGVFNGVPALFMTVALAGAGITAVRRTVPQGTGSHEIGLQHARENSLT